MLPAPRVCAHQPSAAHLLLKCRRYGDSNELWNSLDGIFACVIWDERTGHFTAARDPIGICSLYWGHAEDGSVWFASEMKALQTKCKTVSYFPPVSALPQLQRLGGGGGAAAAYQKRGGLVVAPFCSLPLG